MKPICVCLPEHPEAIEAAKKHFSESGIEDVDFVWCVNAQLAGLATSHTYEVDHPGSGFRMGAKPTGIWLAHLTAWTVAMRYPDEHFLFLETDAKFLPDWKERFDQAWKDVPSNFDFFHIGHCCMELHERTNVKGDVWATKHCQCTHAYIVRRGALPFLLKNVRKCYAPIDAQMVMEIFPHLLTYAIVPRIVEQFQTILPP